MSQRLVGFYSNLDTAERVKAALIEAGISRSDISVFSGKDAPGLWQEIKEFFGFADEEDRALYAEAARRGESAVAVVLEDSETAEQSRALKIIQQFHPVDLSKQAEQWRAEGWTGKAPATHTTSAASSAKTGGKEVFPVTEEQIHVGKRQVLTGGVRVHSYVTQKPVQADVQLRQERVTVERHPADRPVTTGDRAFQDRSIEVTETSEQPVISKQARVVEEVVVGKTAEQKTQTVRDTVKRTDVQVEKLSPDRPEFAQTFASEMADDRRYRGKNWIAVEPEVRQCFEERYPGSKWDQVKDAVHRDYEARQKVKT